MPSPSWLHTSLAVCTLLLACVNGRDRFGELQGLRADASQHAEDSFTEVVPLEVLPLEEVRQPLPRRSYVHYADSTLQERVAKAIRRTAGGALNPDGWTGMTDQTAISAAADQVGTDGSLSYTSAPNTALVLQYTDGWGATVSSASVTTSVSTAVNSGGLLTLLITIAWTANLELCHQTGCQTSAIAATVSSGGSFSTDTDAQLLWSGSMFSEGTNPIAVYDQDLFDGSPAQILEESAVVVPGSSPALLLATDVLTVQARVNLRLSMHEMSPSSIPESTRGAFFSDLADFQVFSGKRWLNNSVVEGHLVMGKGVCAGTCPESMVVAMQRLADAMVAAPCADFTVNGQVTVSLFISSLNVIPLATGASSTYLCSAANNTASVALAIGDITDERAYNKSLVASGTPQIVSIIKARVLAPQGLAAGGVPSNQLASAATTICKNSTNMTEPYNVTTTCIDYPNTYHVEVLRKADLFSSTLSGVLVRDTTPSLEAVRLSFEHILESIHTNITVLDQHIATILPIDDRLSDMFETYLAQAVFPTNVGFIDYVAAAAAPTPDTFDLHFSANGSAVFSLVARAVGNVSDSVRTLARMDEAMNQLGTAMFDQFSISDHYKVFNTSFAETEASSLTATMTAVVLLEGLGTTEPKASTENLFVSGSANFSATFPVEDPANTEDKALFVAVHIVSDVPTENHMGEFGITVEVTDSVKGEMSCGDCSNIVALNTLDETNTEKVIVDHAFAAPLVDLPALQGKLNQLMSACVHNDTHPDCPGWVFEDIPPIKTANGEDWFMGKMPGVCGAYTHYVHEPAMMSINATLAAFDGTGTTNELAAALTADLMAVFACSEGVADISAHVEVNPDPATIGVDIRIHEHENVQITSEVWELSINTKRVAMPLTRTMVISFLLSAAAPAPKLVDAVTMVGHINYVGPWSLPVSHNMVHGNVVWANVALQMNLPSHSNLTIDMDWHVPQQGPIEPVTLKAVIQLDMLNEVEILGALKVDPHRLQMSWAALSLPGGMAAVQSLFGTHRTAFNGSMSVSIAPIADGFGNLDTQFADAAKDLDVWYTFPYRSVQKVHMSAKITTEILPMVQAMNISVSFPRQTLKQQESTLHTCHVTYTSPATLQTVADDFNLALVGCRLAPYLVAKPEPVPDGEDKQCSAAFPCDYKNPDSGDPEQTEDGESGKIALWTTVPGTITKVEFGDLKMVPKGGVEFSGKFGDAMWASFVSMPDFYELVRDLLELPVSTPSYQLVDVTTLPEQVIKSQFRTVFPTQLVHYTFNVSFAHSFERSGVQMNGKILAGDGGSKLYVKMPPKDNRTAADGGWMDAAVSSSLTSGLGVVFDTVPFFGGNMSMVSNFMNNTELDRVIVPEIPAGKNHFEVAMTFQTRTPGSPDTPVYETHVAKVRLTAGNLLKDEMLNFPSTLPGVQSELLSTLLYVPPMNPNRTQIQISICTTARDAGAYSFPTSMEIYGSVLGPWLNNASQISELPATSMVYRPEISAAATVSGWGANFAGTMGPYTVQSCAVNLTANVTGSAYLATENPWMETSDWFSHSFNPAEFFENINGELSSQSYVNVSALILGPKGDVAPFAGPQLYMNKYVEVWDEDDLIDLVDVRDVYNEMTFADPDVAALLGNWGNSPTVVTVVTVGNTTNSTRRSSIPTAAELAAMNPAAAATELAAMGPAAAAAALAAMGPAVAAAAMAAMDAAAAASALAAMGPAAAATLAAAMDPAALAATMAAMSPAAAALVQTAMDLRDQATALAAMTPAAAATALEAMALADAAKALAALAAMDAAAATAAMAAMDPGIAAAAQAAMDAAAALEALAAAASNPLALLSNPSEIGFCDPLMAIMEYFTIAKAAGSAIPFLDPSANFVGILLDAYEPKFLNLKNHICGFQGRFTADIFCNTLTSQWLNSTCDVEFLSNGFLIDFAGPPVQKSFSKSFDLDLGAMFGGGLPGGLGGEGSLALEADLSYMMQLAVLKKASGFTVELTDKTHFQAAVLVDAKASLDVTIGPMTMQLGDATISVGPNAQGLPAGIKISPSAANWKKPEVAIGGAGHFDAAVDIDADTQCKLQIDIPDLMGFATGSVMPKGEVIGCKVADMVAALKKKVLSGGFLDFIQIPTGITDPYNLIVGGICKTLLKILKPIKIPIVGDQLMMKIIKILEDLKDPAMIKKLLKSIMQKVADQQTAKDKPPEQPKASDLPMPKMPDVRGMAKEAVKKAQAKESKMKAEIKAEIKKELKTKETKVKEVEVKVKKQAKEQASAIEDMVLQAFTDALCENLPALKSCPPAPKASDEPKIWVLEFGMTVEPDLGELDFAMGAGPVELEAFCAPTIKFDVGVTVAIEYSGTKGVSITFPKPNIMEAAFELNLIDCGLSGKIIFLGAELLVTNDRNIVGWMTLSNTYAFDIGLAAHIELDATLGFAGSAAGTDASANMFPTFQAKLAMNWDGWSLSGGASMPVFSMTEGKICMAGLISTMVEKSLAKLKPILDPMEPVMGPDSLLLMPLPISVVLGSEMNMLDAMKLMCPKCLKEPLYSNAIKAFKTFAKMYKDIMNVLKLSTLMKDSPCGLGYKIDDFTADFNQKKPKAAVGPPPPPSSKWVVAPEFQASCGWAPAWLDEMLGMASKAAGLRRVIGPAKIRRDGSRPMRRIASGKAAQAKKTKFANPGLQMPLMDDLPGTLMALISGGENKPLVSIIIPDVVVSGQIVFQTVVYPAPPIILIIEIGATVKLCIGEVAFMSDGLKAVMKTKNPAAVFAHLAIRTKTPDGIQIYLATLIIWVKATVSLVLGPIQAQLSVTLTITAKMWLSAMDPELYWITFAELIWQMMKFGPVAAIGMSLKLTLTIGFAILLVIPIVGEIPLFTFDLEITLFDEEWPTPSLPLPGNGNTANLGLGDALAGRRAISFSTYGGSRRSATSVADKCEGQQICDDIAGATGLTDYRIAGQIGEDMWTIEQDTGVMSLAYQSGANPDMAPMVTDLPDGEVVLFGGAASTPFTLRVKNMQRDVMANTAAMAPETLIDVHIDGCGDGFDVSTTGVCAPTACVKTMNCAEINLIKPPIGAAHELSSIPCNLNMEITEMNEIKLVGEPAGFGFPVRVMGDGSTSAITNEMLGKVFHVHDLNVTADASELHFPGNLRELVTAGHPSEEVAYTLHSNPSSRDVKLVGGVKDDFYLVPDIHTIAGKVKVVGGQCDTMNKMEVNFKVYANTLQATKFGSKLVHSVQLNKTNSTPVASFSNQGAGRRLLSAGRRLLSSGNDTDLNVTDSNRMIQVESVQRRVYNFDVEADGAASLIVLEHELRSYSLVDVSTGSQGTFDALVPTCTRYAYLNLKLDGDGVHTLNLGQDDDMKNMQCVIDVKATTPAENVTIFLNAAKDSRNLQWRLSNGRIEALDLSGGPSFRMTHSGVGHYVINFGLGDNEVIHTEGTTGTTTGLFFRNQSDSINLVRIYQNTDGIYIQGNTDVQIGTDAAAGGNVPHNPFDNISAVIAVAGTLVPDATPSRIILRTGKTNLPQASPAQQYGITATGFDLLDPSGLEGQVSPSGEYLDPMRNHSCVCPLVDHSATSISSNGLLTPVTPRMCAWITADGGFGPDACSALHRVEYTTKRPIGGMPRAHFDIVSGEAVDLFCASNSTASLTFNSAAGMDQVCVSSMNPEATGSIDVGIGADLVYLVCPLTNMDLVLGEDTDPDLALVFYNAGDQEPEWVSSTIENIGPDGHKIIVTPAGWQDRIMVRTTEHL